MVAKGCPTASESVYPNTRSDPVFQLRITPLASIKKMAWSFRFPRMKSISRADSERACDTDVFWFIRIFRLAKGGITGESERALEPTPGRDSRIVVLKRFLV